MTRLETQQFFDRRVDAWRRHDVDALTLAHTEDFVLESPFAGTARGRAAIENVYRGFLTSFPDLSIDQPELIVEDGRVQLVRLTSQGSTRHFAPGCGPATRSRRIAARERQRRAAGPPRSEITRRLPDLGAPASRRLEHSPQIFLRAKPA